MADTYTRRLIGTALPPGVTTTLATVPADERWIIRDIVCQNGLTSPATILLYAVTPGGNLAILYESLPNAFTTHHEMRQVLNPGDQVVGFGTVNTISLAITGYLFAIN